MANFSKAAFIAVAAFLLTACASPGVHGAKLGLEPRFRAGMEAHLKKHYGESRPVFERLAAEGHVRSQFMMGTIYEQGLGVPKDLAAAARWYRKAGEGGNDSAQYNLGILYQFGRGVPKDAAKAAHWLRLAADQGHERAQNSLSTLYFTGVGVKRDVVEAWKWLTLSADRLKGQGHKIILDNRVIIEREMTSAQIAEARRRVAEWHRRKSR